ncbi:MAG TPA: zinc-dependent metalloprotease [Actinomycetota bacterium]
MSDPFGLPFGMDPEALRDAPLFRELQRVMAAGAGGPVNWELARQVAVASAVEAGADPEPTEEDRRRLEEAVRVAELQVSAFSGLEMPAEMRKVEAVRRAEWVNANVASLKTLLEPAASRMSEALSRAMREQLPEDAGPMAGLLAQLGPLLQGTQVGQVLGLLAQHVLGQYDIAVPREGTATLRFVVPNLAAFERDWSLDPTEFRTLIAVHEVTHRAEFARPWVRPHFVGLVDDFLSTLTIDVTAIQERFAALDPADPEALQRALGGEDEGALFGTVLDDEQRLKLARVQAFMAAAEGYGDHVMHAIGASLLGTYPRITEALRRYREGEQGDPVFERLLGIDMKKEQYALGRRFCDTVAERSDEATLARMWDTAEAMPSLPELAEPTLWLSRTV